MGEKFCNPVPFSDGKKHTNPDPYIMRWCGRYYCYASDEAGVKVSVSEDMVHWEYQGYAIAEKSYHHYWAPSVIYLDGIFYMYYSNIPIEEEDCHEEHLKLATAKSPLGSFVYQKTFFEKFSIDSHPVVWNGELYLFYSVNDWLGLEPKVAGTCILLDKMISPEEFAGKPKGVVMPSIPQEVYAFNRFGDGRDWYTIEGASPVFRGKNCFMLYSANAYVNVDYFVGTAIAGIKENLSEMVWEKYPNEYTWMPLLKKNHVVEGTGHNTVAKAPNLFEDWIVYHGRDIKDGLHLGTEERNMRIDPLLYFRNRIFCPGPSYEERTAPGTGFCREKEIQAENGVFFAKAPDFYRMEVWCSSSLSHAGAKYMLYLHYTDAKNYVGLKMHSGIRKMSAVWCREGIEAEIEDMDLPGQYRFDIPHLIAVERKKNCFRVTLDEEKYKCMVFKIDTMQVSGKIGAKGCFTPLTIHSAVVAEGAELYGEELFFLSEFYECSCAEIKNGELRSLENTLYLIGRDNSGIRTESFQWRVVSEENQIGIIHGERKLCTLAAANDTVTFYYHRENDRIYLLTDGMVKDKGIMSSETQSGITVLSAESREDAPLVLKAEGLALQEYMQIK